MSVERWLGRELPRHRVKSKCPGEDTVTQGRGGLGSQVLGTGGHLSDSLVVTGLDQGFEVCRMNWGNWRLCEDEEGGQWVGG